MKFIIPNIALSSFLLFFCNKNAFAQNFYEPFELRSPSRVRTSHLDEKALAELREKATLNTLEKLEKIRHTQQTHLDQVFKDIPKNFEFIATDPQATVNKYLTGVKDIADKGNVTVHYKVKVEVNKVEKKPNKKNMKKYKTKKYNIPLKRKSMRLSNFELMMKKLADVNQHAQENRMTTNEVTREISTTVKTIVLKYKPIINKVRPKYAKQPVKEVRRNEIILPSRN